MHFLGAVSLFLRISTSGEFMIGVRARHALAGGFPQGDMPTPP